MKYSELDEDQRRGIAQDLNEAVRDVRHITLDIGKEIQRYLFLVNSGAAVALLAYLGTSDTVRQTTAAWRALIFYAFGIIAVGIFLSINFHMTHTIMILLAKDTQNFYKDELTLSEFHTRRPAIKAPRWPIFCGYVAFACFVAGSITAGLGLYPLVGKASGEGGTVTAIKLTGSARSIHPPGSHKRSDQRTNTQSTAVFPSK